MQYRDGVAAASAREAFQPFQAGSSHLSNLSGGCSAVHRFSNFGVEND